MPGFGLKPTRGLGQTQKQSPFTVGLLSFFSFNEGGGYLVFDTNNRGLYAERWTNSSATFDQDWKPSPVGSGPLFVKANVEYLSIEKRGLPLLDFTGKSFTWMILHYPTTVTWDTVLLGYGEPTGGTRNIIALAYRLDGQMISTTFYNDDADLFLPSSQYMQPGRMYCHVVTYDAGTQRLDMYQNGLHIGGQTMGGNCTSTDKKFRIARRTDNGWDSYDGIVNAVGLWNYKMTTEMVQQLSADPFQVIRPPVFLFTAGGPATQTITPSGIASAETFGTAKLNQNILPSAVTSGQAFGTPKLNLNLLPSGIATAQAFGTAKLNMNIAPSGITSAGAFGTAKLNQNITASGIASAQAFGTAKLTPIISPTGIASAQAFGTPKLNMNITVAGIASAGALGSPAVISGAQFILPTGIASTQAFGLTKLNMNIAPPSIASAGAFGTAKLNMNILPNGVGSGQAFGTAKLNMNILPNGVGSGQSFGVTKLNMQIVVTGIAPTSAFGTAVITGGSTTLSPTGIVSAEVFGFTNVGSFFYGYAMFDSLYPFDYVGRAYDLLIPVQWVLPTGIASLQAVGTPTLLPGPVTIHLVPIDPPFPQFGTLIIFTHEYVTSDHQIIVARSHINARERIVGRRATNSEIQLRRK